MNHRQFEAALKKGSLKLLPFYLFLGPEDFLKEKTLNQVLHFMRQKDRQLHLERIDGSALKLQEILQDVNQATIFTQGRLMFVENPPYFSRQERPSSEKKGKSHLSDQVEKDFLALLKENASDVIIIFSVQEVDRRKKLVKAVEKSGALIEFPLLKGNSLLKWIKSQLAREKKDIEDEALNELVRRTGENLRLIKAELEKINTYAHGEKKITAEIVRLLVPYGQSGNIFNLVSAVGRKNLEEALFHFYKMREQNEHPLVILNMIIRQFRLLFRSQVIKDNKGSRKEIINSLNLPPFVVNDLMQQLNNYDRHALAEIFILLKEADMSIKTGRREAGEEVEQLILKLTAV